MTAPRRLLVPVAGGRLAGARWGPSPGRGRGTVLAAHGLTSSWRFWTLVGEALADEDITLVAPDLRGRGHSADLPGPWGIAAHVDDLVAVLDHIEVDEVILAGHSMGGFVAAMTAAEHPGRIVATLLIDGGLALTDPLPPDADVDAVIAGIVGPSLARLDRRFASVAEHREFWREHPAFAEVPDDLVDAYADHDLVGDPPELRSGVVARAVRADATDILLADEVRLAADRLPAATVFLAAERGMLDEPAGLYAPDRLAELPAAAGLDVEVVPDTNHFTIGMSRHGAAVVADRLLALVEEAP